MSDSRREKIQHEMYMYRFGKNYCAPSWKTHYHGTQKRSTHPGDSSKTSQIMPHLRWGSYNDLQSAAKPALTLEPLLSPSSCTLSLDHCIPDSMVSSCFPNSPSTFLSQGLCLCYLVWNGRYSPVTQKIPFLTSFSSQIQSRGSLSWPCYIK